MKSKSNRQAGRDSEASVMKSKSNRRAGRDSEASVMKSKSNRQAGRDSVKSIRPAGTVMKSKSKQTGRRGQ